MSTQAITYVVPSPAWTGTVDVTAANLLTDTSVADFTLLYDGVEQGTVEKTFWTKTSYTQLTYSGSSLTTGITVTIRRKTPNSVVQAVSPQSIILSSLWNAEFDRQIRWREEADAFFHSTVPVSGNIVDTAFGVSWNGVTGDAPSKNTINDIFNVDTLNITPKWTITSGGTLTAATGSIVTFGSGSSVVFNSAASVTGTVDMDGSTAVLVPTRARVDAGGEHTTNASSQAWVYSTLPKIFEARLSVSSSNPIGRGTTSTIYLHPYKGNALSLYDNSRWEVHFLSGTVSLALGTMTDNLPYDIFLYNNSGTLTLEKTAWTNASTRATALTTQNGIYVKTGSTNKRYVGTVFSRGSDTVEVSAATIDQTYSAGYHDAIGYKGLVNYYNQEDFVINKIDIGSSYLQNTQVMFSSLTGANLYEGVAGNYAKWAIVGTGLSDPFTLDYRLNVYSQSASSTINYAIHKTWTAPASWATADDLVSGGAAAISASTFIVSSDVCTRITTDRGYNIYTLFGNYTTAYSYGHSGSNIMYQGKF
jgi:hypothetical protein